MSCVPCWHQSQGPFLMKGGNIDVKTLVLLWISQASFVKFKGRTSSSLKQKDKFYWTTQVRVLMFQSTKVSMFIISKLQIPSVVTETQKMEVWIGIEKLNGSLWTSVIPKIYAYKSSRLRFWKNNPYIFSRCNWWFIYKKHCCQPYY